jgi:predicted enzyme related to lactoylglutathione lyase
MREDIGSGSTARGDRATLRERNAAMHAVGHALPAPAPRIRSASELTAAKESCMPPTLTNGKVCYLEIPAIDIRRSATFYEAVVGWQSRERGDGSLAFDDGVGGVSGTWVTGRAPSATPGVLVYIMVDSIAATLSAVVDHGGEVVQPAGAELPEVTARFRDPAGNVLGLYEERVRADKE